jgi:hypothetical protein
MKPIRTFNPWHIGDHIQYLNFIRRVAKAMPDQEFIHYARWDYLKELQDVIEDLSNIKLAELGHMLPPDAQNVWMGHENYWYNSPLQNDMVAFHLDWYEHLAKRLKVENRIKTVEDMRFDYPKILKPLQGGRLPPTPFDVLVISSAPASGQFQGYNHFALINLAARMANNGLKVVITTELPKHIKNVYSTVAPGRYLSITQIGHLSLHCHTIVGVSTGPDWPTHNIWNLDSVKQRILMLDKQRVWLSPNTTHCESVPAVEALLTERGLL